MNQVDDDYSTQKITPQLISHIVETLRNKAYGSIEIFVENYMVTQITQRTITKLKNHPQQAKKFPKAVKSGIGSRFSQVLMDSK